jgi:hypothetical protein
VTVGRADLPGNYDLDVPRVHVVDESSASPERVLEAARDFSPRRRSG